jgi:hypothetical protein
MKKILLVLSAFSWASFTANAQITVTSANYINASTGINQKVDTLPVAGIVPGNAGANVTYDFSALHTASLTITSQITFTTVATGVQGSSYSVTPANMCMHQDTSYMYFDTSATKMEFWGIAGNLLRNSVNNAMVYSNPQTVITFPSTYNTTFTDVAAYDNKFVYGALYQGIWVDSLREKETITTTSKIDGWGTVKTPNSQFPCLRQNIKKHSVDTAFAKIFVGGYHYWMLLYGDTSNTQSYSYISDSNNGPIVDIEYYSDSSKIYQVRWNTAFVNTVSQYNTEAGFIVFPNPVSDYLTINYTSNENFNAIIYDLTGREVLNAAISKLNSTISVANLENGTYIIRVFNKEGLVKSNKITIIH